MSGKRGQGFTSEQGAVLQAFSRALDREAHVLTQHPELLWQKICDRPRMVSKSLMEEHLR